MTAGTEAATTGTPADAAVRTPDVALRARDRQRKEWKEKHDRQRSPEDVMTSRRADAPPGDPQQDGGSQRYSDSLPQPVREDLHGDLH